MDGATNFAAKFADKNASTDSSVIELTLFQLGFGITPEQATIITRHFLNEKSFTKTDLQLFFYRMIQPFIQKTLDSDLPVLSSRTPVTRTIAASVVSDKASWSLNKWVCHYAGKSKGYFNEDIKYYKTIVGVSEYFKIVALICENLLADPVRLERFLDHAETEYGIRPKLPRSFGASPCINNTLIHSDDSKITVNHMWIVCALVIVFVLFCSTVFKSSSRQLQIQGNQIVETDNWINFPYLNLNWWLNLLIRRMRD